MARERDAFSARAIITHKKSRQAGRWGPNATWSFEEPPDHASTRCREMLRLRAYLRGREYRPRKLAAYNPLDFRTAPTGKATFHGWNTTRWNQRRRAAGGSQGSGKIIAWVAGRPAIRRGDGDRGRGIWNVRTPKKKLQRCNFSCVFELDCPR